MGEKVLYVAPPKEKVKQKESEKLSNTYAPVDVRSLTRTYSPTSIRLYAPSPSRVHAPSFTRVYAPAPSRVFAPSSTRVYAPSTTRSLSETYAPSVVYGMRNTFPSLSEVFAQQIPGIAETYVYDMSPVFPSLYEQKPEVKLGVDDHVNVISAPAIPPIPPRSNVIFSPRDEFHPVNINSMSEDRSFHYSDSHSETKIINFNPINVASLSIGTTQSQPSKTVVDILTNRPNEPTAMLYYAFFKALAKR